MDAGSYSNIMVYGGNQWVAYMDDNNKATRTAIYQGYNFGGTTDWAVDLQSFQDTSYDPYEPSRRVVTNNYTYSWQSINCNNNEAAVNQTEDPATRWTQVGADTAWTDMLTAWAAYTGPEPFITFVSNFFVGPQDLGCGGIGRDSCDGGWGCVDTQAAAGFFILDSLAWIDNVSILRCQHNPPEYMLTRQINNNLYTACGDAQGYMTSQMGPFSSTFAPIVDESLVGKIMLDLLGLGFALSVAPIWNIGKFFPYFSVQTKYQCIEWFESSVFVGGGVKISCSSILASKPYLPSLFPDILQC